MPFLPAFSPSREFLTAVLPGLIPTTPSLTHVVASYNEIGSRRPSRPTEVLRENDLTTLLFPGLTLARIQSDVSRTIATESDPSVPMLATVYVGGRQFVEMMQLVVLLRDLRPDVRVAVIACPCVTPDQETTIRRGVRAGKLAAAAWCDCGGRNMARDILREVQKIWAPAGADVQISLLSADSSPDLGA